jgi:CDP-6-deoxy-D-xylo-4-hexulose-3-dehydrase
VRKGIEKLRQEILDKVVEYYGLALDQEPFHPGQTRIPYAGRVFDSTEMVNLIDAGLEFWLTYGRYSQEFERKLGDFLGIRHCFLVNSGSSANLLAFMALTAPELGVRRIQREDEVITVAAGFPTTVAPIIQYGAVPVFVDVDLATANIDTSWLEPALSERTRAVMIAHTLGNPFNLRGVKGFCHEHGLWLIEDNCDALGSRYEGRYTGTFGDIGTSSFYPPHHMTMGEGGAVYTDDPRLARIILSMRDWGRDCVCPSGVDNLCGRRFGRQFGELPFGYDHKYIYSHFGYNLKVTDIQAAVGVAQLDKLPSFIAARQRNWSLLRTGLGELSDKLILPQATVGSDPSWFGFLLTVREGSGLTRDQIVNQLEADRIQTRMLFAGNLVKHPCFDEMRAGAQGYRVVGELKNTDIIMNQSFWVGVYPGMTPEMIEFLVNRIKYHVNAGGSSAS